MSTPAANAEATAPAPATRSRALRNAAIAGFLLYQIVMPLRYYLGGGGTDERFSWRMFSSIRMQKCDFSVRETAGGKEHKVDIGAALQIAWIGMLERNRPAVVEKVLVRRCAEPGVSAVRYERKCQETDGSWSAPFELDRDCKSGALTQAQGTP
jgi:hypothetical protein